MAAVDVLVELYYSGAWHDVTADVRVAGGITITPGRADESQAVSPATCTLTFGSKDGKYSPRNPMSSLFGLIGRNTPLRVSVGDSVRFGGEVESWPPRWDVSGRDAWVPITAYGIMRRLGAGGTNVPARSALYRAIKAGSTPVAWWPLESEGAIADVFASAIDGGLTGVVVSETAPGAASGPDGSAGAITVHIRSASILDAGPLTLPVVRYPSSNTTVMTVHMRQSVTTSNAVLGGMSFITGGGTVARILLTWANTGSTALAALALDSSDSLLFSTGGSGSSPVDGAWHEVQVRAVQSGGTLTLSIWLDGVQVDSDSATQTLGTVTAVGGLLAATWDSGTGNTLSGEDGAADWDLCHVSVHTAAVDYTDAMSGFPGETVAQRLDRLDTEDGLTTNTFGDAATLLGPQLPGTSLGLRQEAADADGGILCEARGDLELVYVAHDALVNPLTAALTLSYSAKEVAPPLEPTEDTQHVLNIATVSRKGGSSSTVRRDTGPLNTSLPADDPDGVGEYPVDVELSLYEDRQTLQQAAWVTHLGTWPDARYPVVTVDLTALAVAGKTSLIDDALNVFVSDRIAITDPPLWAQPDDIGAIVQGYTETIDSHHHVIAFNCTPAGAWVTNQLGTSRLDTKGSTTTGSLTTTATSVAVSNVDGGWSTNTPYDITIDGERMTVTNAHTPGASQTLTVTRSVNGVVKTHAASAKVRLYLPFRLGR